MWAGGKERVPCGRRWPRRWRVPLPPPPPAARRASEAAPTQRDTRRGRQGVARGWRGGGGGVRRRRWRDDAGWHARSLLTPLCGGRGERPRWRAPAWPALLPCSAEKGVWWGRNSGREVASGRMRLPPLAPLPPKVGCVMSWEAMTTTTAEGTRRAPGDAAAGGLPRYTPRIADDSCSQYGRARFTERLPARRGGIQKGQQKKIHCLRQKRRVQRTTVTRGAPSTPPPYKHDRISCPSHPARGPPRPHSPHPVSAAPLFDTLDAVLNLLVELAQPVKVLLRRLPVTTAVRLKKRRHHRAERVGVELQ